MMTKPMKLYPEKYGPLIALLVFAALALAGPVAADRTPNPGESASLESLIQDTLHAFSYNETTGGWYARNAENRITLVYTKEGMAEFSGPGNSFGLTLNGIGREGPIAPVPEGSAGADGRQLVITRPGFTEWYRNNDEGVEQGVTVMSSPAGNGPLLVRFGITGNSTFSPGSGQALTVTGSAGSPIFTYTGLHATGADGRELSASLATDGKMLSWIVDDAGAVYPVVIDPWIATQTATLAASDAAADAQFGNSVAVSGDTAVIGAIGADGMTGRAYVFTRSGGTWSQSAILNAPDPANDLCFGNSVALSEDGNTVVIGSFDQGMVGRAYVFAMSGGSWSQAATLHASEVTGVYQFGNSVALSGDGNTAVIGAPSADAGTTGMAGQAYVFANSGGTWSQSAILRASDAAVGAGFGNSVAVSGDGNAAVIGATWATAEGKSNAGQAYVFANSGGTWSQSAILGASDAAANAQFGNSVAASGDGNTAVIGANQATAGGKSNAGQAYIFKRSGAAWSQAIIMSPSDAAADAQFGNSMAISGDAVLAGAYRATVGSEDSAGQAYVFCILSSAPIVYGITPASWPNTEYRTVEVSGNGFSITAAPVLVLRRAGYSNISVTASTLISASLFRVTIPSGNDAGVWNVTVVNPEGQEGTNASVTFTITAPPHLAGISPASGANTSATLVTVTGTQFNSTAAPVVNLTRAGSGNITMTGTNLSATAFTVSVPEDVSSGAWNVVVINPDGLEATDASVTFTVTAPPRLAGIDPESGEDSMATLVTVTGSQFSSSIAPVVKLTSAGNSDIILTGTNLSATSFTVLVPNHNLAAVWNVTVINPDGLEGTNASVTFTTIDPAPDADFSFDPAAGPAPLTVTFTDQSVNVPESWYWDFGDGDSTDAMLQNPVHTYANAGIYTVSLSATNTVGTGTKIVRKGISVMAQVTRTAVLNAASDAAADDRFGASVALSGDGTTALVAAEWINLAPTPPGRVYVFKKNGATWSRIAVLCSPDAADGDEFGSSVALSYDGNTALIGAGNARMGTITSAGQAYVFRNNAGTWSLSSILSASDAAAGDHFGTSVALSGDGNTAFIGADSARVGTDNWAGKVYVFTGSGNSWSQKQILIASDTVTFAYFGHSVALSGDTAVIGAYEATAGTTDSAGQAYVFKNSGGTWSESAILSASNPARYEYFGYSTALSDDGKTAFIGAPWATVNSADYAGKVYVFTDSGGAWSQSEVLSAPEAVDLHYFGNSIAISGDAAVVSNIGKIIPATAGRAYIYRKDEGSWFRTHVLKDADATGYDGFGWSVALRRTTALVGATLADTGTTADAGQAYFFTFSTPAPVVAGISPEYGANTSATTVTITGTDFDTLSAPLVKLTRTGYADVTLGVVSGTGTTLVRTVPAHTVAGTWNVVVINPDGQEGTTASVTYTVLIPPPSVTSVIPATGVNTSAVSVEITGSLFNTTIPGGTAVSLTRSGYTNISATGITPVSGTAISASLPITHAESGIWYLVVVNPDGQESTESIPFRVTDPDSLPPPSVLSVNPATGVNTGAVGVVITGTGFNTTPGFTTTVKLTRAGESDITVIGLIPASDTEIEVTLPVTGAAAGTWNVIVINPDGQESTETVPFVVTTTIPTTAPTTVPTTSPITATTTTSTGSSSSGTTSGSSDNTDDFPSSGFPLMTVTVNVGGDSKAWQAIVTGTKLSDLIVTGTEQHGSGSNCTPLQGSIFQYFSLVPARYGTITNAVINFTIPRSWLDENQIAPGSIVLYRMTPDCWQPLPTAFLYSKDGTAYFSAKSAGFSLFAIAGTPSVATPVITMKTPAAVNMPAQPQTPAAAVNDAVAAQTTVPPAPVQAPAGSSAFPVVPVLIGIGSVVLIAGGWYIRRWWIRRQNPALFREYD
jgi:PKD repeat protein